MKLWGKCTYKSIIMQTSHRKIFTSCPCSGAFARLFDLYGKPFRYSRSLVINNQQFVKTSFTHCLVAYSLAYLYLYVYRRLGTLALIEILK